MTAIAMNKHTLCEVFENWLNKTNSENTLVAYSRIVKQFFSVVYEKKLDEVNESDLLEITPMFIDHKYKNVLTSRGLSNSTVNHQLKIVAAFFKQLDINSTASNVNYRYITEVALKSDLKEDGGSTVKMTLNDVNSFRLWLINERFTKGRYASRGTQFSQVADVLWHTGSRVSAIFNIKWVDFIYEEDSVGQFGYNLYVLDKGGKTNRKPIDNDLYEQLKETFYNGKDNEKVFKGLSSQGFRSVMTEYGKLVGKNFTPHSIKKGAVSALYFLTKDLEMVKRFADHESLDTTLGYIEVDNDRTQHGSYILSNSNTDMSVLKDLSKEQLLLIINERTDLQHAIHYAATSKGYIKEKGVKENETSD